MPEGSFNFDNTEKIGDWNIISMPNTLTESNIVRLSGTIKFNDEFKNL